MKRHGAPSTVKIKRYLRSKLKTSASVKNFSSLKMAIEYRTGFLAIKTLEFHADILRKGKELYKAEHIFNVCELQIENTTTIKGQCVRQGSITKVPYKILLNILPDHSVFKAHCTCLAGADGQCKHTSALVRFSNELVPNRLGQYILKGAVSKANSIQ